MKKFISCLLAFVLLLCFAACTNEGQSAKEQTIPREEREFSLGRVDGNIYESEFIGIGCTLDQEWSFYSEEQIKTLNNVAEDMLPEDFLEAVKDVMVIYDMYALGENQLDTISVNLEKVDKTALAALDLSENYEKAIPILMQSFENMGYTDVSYEISSLRVEDQDFPSLRTCVKANGVTVYQEAFSIKCNGYIANVTLTAYNEDNIDALVENFYLLD
ncbi:MAG: hypothetical protein IJP07_02780 [Firmicutes bacterium]|nr:hypothetical protein [Bacillota bacterium]